MQSSDPAVGGNESVAPCRPFVARARRLEFLQTVARVDPRRDRRPGFLDHPQIGFQIARRSHRTVARNNPGFGVGLRQYRAARRKDPVHRAPAIHIDEGEPLVEKRIAHVDDIGAGEENEGVSVCVGMGNVQHPDFLPIEMDGKGLGEGNHRQGGGRGGRRNPVAALLFGRQPGADIVVGDNGSFCAKFRIAARVIAVKMGVEQKFEVALAKVLEQGANLIGQRGEFVVHHQEAVRPGGNADIAASRPVDHVDGSGDMGHRKVLRVLGGNRQGCKQKRKKQGSGHGRALGKLGVEAGWFRLPMNIRAQNRRNGYEGTGWGPTILYPKGHNHQWLA